MNYPNLVLLLANNGPRGEMTLNAAFYKGLPCLQNSEKKI